jgi:N-acetylmuramoyl-L-alanine amidase
MAVSRVSPEQQFQREYIRSAKEFFPSTIAVLHLHSKIPAPHAPDTRHPHCLGRSHQSNIMLWPTSVNVEYPVLRRTSVSSHRCALLALSSVRAGVLGVALLVAACAPAPPRIGSPSEWVASPSFDERRPNIVVLHHTTNDTAGQALQTLTNPALEVSSHYLIARDGTLYQLVDERYRAWHAGLSRWGAITDLNSASIGIELDNNGEEPFPAQQIEVLLALLADLKSRYDIPRANFLGHADVAPGRKVDPSRYFPWHTLAEHEFGLWCDPPLPAAPPDLDVQLALQALGYDPSRLEAAVHAFKLHFIQDDPGTQITPRDRDMLHCLLRQRAAASN